MLWSWEGVFVRREHFGDTNFIGVRIFAGVSGLALLPGWGLLSVISPRVVSLFLGSYFFPFLSTCLVGGGHFDVLTLPGRLHPPGAESPSRLLGYCVILEVLLVLGGCFGLGRVIVTA